MLKKFLSNKLNVTKNALFFLSRVPTHHIFTFNSRFLHEHKVHLSLIDLLYDDFSITTLFKRDLHRCFPVNIVKFLATPILKNICERLLLYLVVLLYCSMNENSFFALLYFFVTHWPGYSSDLFERVCCLQFFWRWLAPKSNDYSENQSVIEPNCILFYMPHLFIIISPPRFGALFYFLF